MKRTAPATALLLLAVSAGAHELSENRATLVLRDKTHLAVTVYVNYAEVLHLALAPQRPLPEFLAVYAAMKPADLQKQLLRVQVKFQTATRLYLASGTEIALANWVWPDAAQVQTLLQQTIMRAIAGPNAHTHEDPLEIHADAVASAEIQSVRIRFPDEFGKVLVVAYRPTQLWVEPNTLSPAIRF